MVVPVKQLDSHIKGTINPRLNNLGRTSEGFCNPIDLACHFWVLHFEMVPALFCESDRSIADIFEELHRAPLPPNDPHHRAARAALKERVRPL